MATVCFMWNDGRHSGGRYPKLAFVKDGKIYPFSGSNIDGVAIVTATKYEKSGKWSNTDFSITVAPNVGVWNMISRLHGSTFEDQHTWEEALAYFINATTKIVTMDEFQKYMREHYKHASERFDETAKLLPSINIDEKLEVSFGSPTNRQIGDGFWTSPKPVRDQTGKEIGGLALKNKNESWQYGDKNNIIPPEGYDVIDVTTSPGMHGGYVTVVLAKRKA
jgi:hypothetical protein